MSAEAAAWALKQSTGNSTTKLVLLILADVADENGESYYGQEKLASMAETTTRTLRDHLKNLEAMGLLERRERRRESGYRTSDLYRLLIHSEISPEDSSPEKSDLSHRKPASGQHEPKGEPSGVSSSLRSEDEGAQGSLLPTVTPSENGNGERPWNGGVILAAWCEKYPATAQAMSGRERGKLGAACKRLAEEHSREEVLAAWIGIERIAPYSMGEPWDPMDLERKFAKAMAAAENHPALQEEKFREEFEREAERRGL